VAIVRESLEATIKELKHEQLLETA
jgi:hypothetical protein